MPQVGFELTISAGERPKTYSLDQAATGTGFFVHIRNINGLYENKHEVTYLGVKFLL